MGTASEQSELSDGTSPPPAGVDRRKVLVYLTALALVVLVADQASKIIALEQLEPGVYHPLLGEWFGLRLVFNPGAAFSLATGMTWIFTIAAVVVTVVIIAIAPRLRSYAWATGLGVLLGGNLGNLVDRLFREPGFARGHVVDFLSYGGWFIGNVADIAIVIGAPMIAVLMMRGIGLDGVRVPGGTGKQEEEPAGEDDRAEDEAGDHEAGDHEAGDDLAGDDETSENDPRGGSGATGSDVSDEADEVREAEGVVAPDTAVQQKGRADG